MCPFYGPGLGVEADVIPVSALIVEVIADSHRRREIGLQIRVAPGLFNFETAAGFHDPEAHGAERVGINRDGVAYDDGRAGVAFGVGLQRHAPEDFAVRTTITGERIGGEINDLLNAGEGGDDRRGVSGFVVPRFPNHLAVQLVKTDERGAVRVSDRDNYPIALHDTGTVVATARGGAGVGFGAEEFDAEMLVETGSPNHFAIGQTEAAKLAFAGLHIDALSIDQRRAPRSGAPFVFITVSERHVPDSLSRLRLDQVRYFLVAVFIQVNQLAAGNHR